MDTTLYKTLKVAKCKSRLFKDAQSMSRRPTGSVFIGNIINYRTYLPNPFPRGLEVDLKGSSTFLTLMLLMHTNRLGLFSHLYGCLFHCITVCQGRWASAATLCMEVRWCCTIAVSVLCSKHQLPEYRCTVKRFCTPLRHLNAAYMSIYSRIQPYIHVFECIY